MRFVLASLANNLYRNICICQFSPTQQQYSIWYTYTYILLCKCLLALSYTYIAISYLLMNSSGLKIIILYFFLWVLLAQGINFIPIMPDFSQRKRSMVNEWEKVKDFQVLLRREGRGGINFLVVMLVQKPTKNITKKNSFTFCNFFLLQKIGENISQHNIT